MRNVACVVPAIKKKEKHKPEQETAIGDAASCVVGRIRDLASKQFSMRIMQNLSWSHLHPALLQLRILIENFSRKNGLTHKLVHF